MPRNGKVAFIDIAPEDVLSMHKLPINNNNYAKDAPDTLQLLNRNPSNTSFRLIFAKFSRSTFKAMDCYASIDRAGLDTVTIKDNVYPEVLLMYFGMHAHEIEEASVYQITGPSRQLSPANIVIFSIISPFLHVNYVRKSRIERQMLRKSHAQLRCCSWE